MLRLGTIDFVPTGDVTPALARLEAMDASGLVVIEIGPRVAARSNRSADPRALEELRRLPCLLIGLICGPPADPVGQVLMDVCDLCLDPVEAGLDRRLRELEREAARPEVILLATLLRRHGDDVADGLLLESLGYSALQSGETFRSWLAQR